MRENRGPWYLLTGLLIGVGLGLLIAWVVVPLKYKDTAPISLSEPNKERYRALIAAAYLANGDLARARDRLNLLGDPDPGGALITQAQRAMSEGRPEAEVKALSLLGVAMVGGATLQPVTAPTVDTYTPIASSTTQPPTPQVTATLTPTPVIASTFTPKPSYTATPFITPTRVTGTPTPPSPTPTPTASPTDTHTPTPTATPAPPFVLSEKTFVCASSLPGPLIQIQTRDAAGQPVPGVEGFVYWEGGNDHFFTGLKPDLGLGYADFQMSPGIVYTVQLADGGQPVRELKTSECTTNAGAKFWGSWLIIFAQP